VKQEIFSSLIETLYDAALEPTGWQRAAQLIARAFETESCTMFRLELAHGSAELLGITENFDAKAIAEYEAYYHQKDLWAIAMSKSGTGRAMLSSELVGAKEFFNSEIFDGYAKRIGIFEAVASVFPLEEQSMGAIGVHRPHGSHPFGADDKRLLAMLLPHVSRAMLLHRRLKGITQGRRLALEALEHLSVAMIAVDARATVLFANAMAERLLSAGLGLTCRQGCLGVADASKDDELRRLIRQAGLAANGRSGEAGGVLALPRADGPPLSLMVCPLRTDALPRGPTHPAALLIFGDPDLWSHAGRGQTDGGFGRWRASGRLCRAPADQHQHRQDPIETHLCEDGPRPSGRSYPRGADQPCPQGDGANSESPLTAYTKWIMPPSRDLGSVTGREFDHRRSRETCADAPSRGR
jgi:hypothetical protein